MSRKTFVILVGSPVLFCIVALVTRHITLGGATVINLQPAAPLVGQISQDLGSGPGGSFLLYGKDYSLATHYFYNNTWVVASIKPLRNNFDPNIIVMEKLNGNYQTVLGPGSAFTNDQILGLPSSVANYLRAGG